MLLLNRIRRGFPLLVLCVVVPIVTGAQTVERDVLLVPVLTEPLPGAFGALWRTEVWFMRTSELASIAPVVDRNCLPPRCGPPPPPLPQPFEAVQPPLYRTRAGEPPGVLLYVPKDTSRDVTLNVRVADTSRQGLTDGVAIPVVREEELRESVHLLDVGVTPHSRVMLRVYDPFAPDFSRVRVRAWSIALADQLVLEQEVVLRRAATDAIPNWTLPVVPASAELSLPLPQPASGRTPYRVEVLAASTGLRLWAFASVTNNNTNEVTIVTP